MLPEEPEYGNSEGAEISRPLWAIARKCWRDKPSERPSATDIFNNIRAGFPEEQHSEESSPSCSTRRMQARLENIFASFQVLNLAGCIEDHEDSPHYRNEWFEYFKSRSTKHRKAVLVLKANPILTKYEEVCTAESAFESCP